MPIITDIQQQKRSKGRFSIYVDEKYAFSLADLELSMSGLRVGQELTTEAIDDFRDQGEESKAYHKALGFLGIRSRSEWEMKEYLLRKSYDEETIQAVVSRLKRAKLLGDLLFAENWVANRQALKPSSRRKLEQELSVKRVSREVISAALAGIDSENELTALVGQMEKKRRLAQYRETEKLLGYFARQGYSYELIKKALEALESQSSEETESSDFD